MIEEVIGHLAQYIEGIEVEALLAAVPSRVPKPLTDHYSSVVPGRTNPGIATPTGVTPRRPDDGDTMPAMGIGVLSVSSSVLASTNSAALDVDAIRIALHLLAMAVWIGGQVIMMALLPVLREVDGLPTKAAQAFGRVAWPAFAVAVASGIWNIMVVPMADVSTGYNIALGIKLLLVIVAGAATFMHQRATTASMRGATAGIGFLASLIVVVLGAMMAH